MVRYLFVLLVVGGCATPTPEERAAALIEKHGPVCERLGFTARSESWGRCVMERERERKQNAGVICVPAYGAMICS